MAAHGDQLRLGMTMEEVTAILGEPAAGTSYSEYLEKMARRGASVVRVGGSSEAAKQREADRFYIWRRSEGDYSLVFRGGRLLKIQSAP